MSTVIGLTGQSGAGKTLISYIFEREGFGIINCDHIAREVTHAGSQCNNELAKYFPSCFDKDLVLDRRALGQIVFSDKDKLELLNSIIFKYIRKTIDEKTAELSRCCEFILLDAPTLFEAGADTQCDIIVSVIASEKTRLSRVIERDGIDERSAAQRFSSQKSEDYFKTHSDYIIINEGSRDDAAAQTEIIIKQIKEGKIGNNKK